MLDRLLLLVFDRGYVNREGERLRQRMLWAGQRVVTCSDENCGARYSQEEFVSNNHSCPVCFSDRKPVGYLDPLEGSMFR